MYELQLWTASLDHNKGRTLSKGHTRVDQMYMRSAKVPIQKRALERLGFWVGKYGSFIPDAQSQAVLEDGCEYVSISWHLPGAMPQLFAA
ncbi:unnamed protein product [Cuscuta campestris]|uniref:Uncharacterized protein n=1 Tax=Cuscuta campestris TaxID=132261 RepID=A0A484N8D5_9ASTE|nr:unnamed protein product [Cuscuta campestris]